MTGRPKRVLQIVRGMDRAGVENWLMNVLRRLDRRRVEMDFLVHTPDPGAHDTEIRERGARLLRCTSPTWSPAYALAIERVLRGSVPYDAIHSHVHHFSGYVLALAKRAGVARRIAHSHSDTGKLDAESGALRRGYLRWMQRLLHRNATSMVAVSRNAASALFGQLWEQDPRSLVLRCGIDPAPFRGVQSPSERAHWNLAESDFVVGHVGRFAAPKNHLFLLEVFEEIRRTRPDARLLLVGDGLLREEIETHVRQRHLAAFTVFAGAQDNVAPLFRTMDICVFPSLYEGLPLSVLEAQAAGVRCVVSHAVTEESEVVPSLIERVSLTQPPARWAEVVLGVNRRPAPDRAEAFSAMEKSGFNIANSMEQLYALYNA